MNRIEDFWKGIPCDADVSVIICDVMADAGFHHTDADKRHVKY
jgi:hypothetical protein